MIILFYSLHIGYTKELFTEVYSAIESGTCVPALKPSPPPPLCSKYDKPSKTFAIEQHMSRFKNQ